MRIVRRLALLPALAALAVLGTLAAPSATLASCVQPPSIQDAARSAEIVFVGTVVETANRNTWATVQVEEIWRGPDQPTTIVIRGGPGGNAASSVDRTFEVGVRYLFFPYADETGGLADNSCTSTTQWSADLAALRPGDVRAPAATPPANGFDVMSIAVPAGMALLVAGLLLGVGLLARGRDRA